VRGPSPRREGRLRPPFPPRRAGPGRVTAETSSYLRADAVEVVLASPDRVTPPCPHAGPGRCGGCDFQHVEIGAQRRLKEARITELLAQLARIERRVEVEPVAGGTADGLGWRTRLRLAVNRNGVVGLHRHRSHLLEHLDSCLVAHPTVVDTGVLRTRWPGASELEVVAGTTPGDALVTVTPRGRGTPHLPGVDPGVVVRGKFRRAPGAVHVMVRGRTYRVSAGVFWQAHIGAAEALLGAVLAAAGDRIGIGSTAVDLYAGAGLFSVPLAAAVGPSGSVLAIERDARACADARHNAASLPNLRVERAEVTPELVASGIGRPAVALLDPAREGAGVAVIRALAGHGPTLRRIVYVSCDAASFSRDTRALFDEGWSLSSLRAFDIFPMTEHVELVGALDPPSH
jgi:tRNA/tmRNA/rRNA uracil-C5-methylase (TrmA/RlmC/RlmD family)